RSKVHRHAHHTRAEAGVGRRGAERRRALRKESEDERWRHEVTHAVRWAARHEPGDKAKGLKKTLLELKGNNPAAFFRVLLPLVPAAERNQAGDGEPGPEEMDRAEKQLNEWLASLGAHEKADAAKIRAGRPE